MRKLDVLATIASVVLILLTGNIHAPRVQADEQQICRVTEFPVKVAPE